MKKFITYMEKEVIFRTSKGKEHRLPKAAVWAWNGYKWNVVDTGDDIKHLQFMHNVSDLEVYNEATDLNADGTLSHNDKTTEL